MESDVGLDMRTGEVVHWDKDGCASIVNKHFRPRATDWVYKLKSLQHIYQPSGHYYTEKLMKTRGTIYIAGPIRGVPQLNFPAFYKAEALLELWGYTVINPARMDIEQGKAHWNHTLNDVILDNSFTMENALSRDFKEILHNADAIVVLDNWGPSSGANKEAAFTVSIGKDVFAFKEDKPLDITNDVPLELNINVECTPVSHLESLNERV